MKMTHILPGETYVIPTADSGRVKGKLSGIHLHGQPSDAVECCICGALSKNYLTFSTDKGELVVGITCAAAVGAWTDAIKRQEGKQ